MRVKACRVVRRAAVQAETEELALWTSEQTVDGGQCTWGLSSSREPKVGRDWE